MGLLGDDGRIYLLIANHDSSKPFDDAKDLAGARVEIKGSLSKQGSLEAIEVLSVAAAK